MPEKPANAFKLFCRTQSGKDIGQLHRAFAELEPEKKTELQAEAKEDEQRYKDAVEEWNNSEAGKKYLRALAAYEKKKRLGEAKARFLGDMPKKPDGAFRIFLNDKRDEVARANPDLKGLGAVTGKLATMFRDLSDEDKQIYAEKERQAKEEYEEKMKEFESSADYKKYKQIENKMSGKGASSKAKAKAKASAGPVPPPPPDSMPKRPPMAFFMFRQATRGTPKEIQQKWLDLKAEGQKEWNDKAKEKLNEYESEMKEFQRTAEGKKYLRLKAVFEKKQAEKKVKDRYLSAADAPQEPKRPMGAYFLYVTEKRADVQRELGTGKLSEVSSKLTQVWNAMPKEEKEVYETKAEEAKKEYEKQLQEYKNSEAFKKYERAMASINRSKSAKPKAAAGRGRGAGAKGGGRGAADAQGSDSDSDVMGSDSSNSSSSDSDSD